MREPQTQERAARWSAREQRTLLRVGGSCGIVGTVILATALALHGDLPADVSTTAALRYVVSHPGWLVIHLAMIVAGILWVAAFTALAATLAPGRAAAVGRLLAASAVLGGTFFVFNYAVDGYGLHELADDWAAASGPEQDRLLLLADAALRILIGSWMGEIVVFYGLTFLLAGLAVALDGRYPAWFGGVAAVAGALVLVAGLSTLAGLQLTADWLVFAVIQPVEGLWLVALGVMMWRRTPA